MTTHQECFHIVGHEAMQQSGILDNVLLVEFEQRIIVGKLVAVRERHILCTTLALGGRVVHLGKVVDSGGNQQQQEDKQQPQSSVAFLLFFFMLALLLMLLLFQGSTFSFFFLLGRFLRTEFTFFVHSLLSLFCCTTGLFLLAGTCFLGLFGSLAGLLLGLGSHLLHLANGSLCKVINTQLTNQSIDYLSLNRSLFHFLFSMFYLLLLTHILMADSPYIGLVKRYKVNHFK